MGNGSSTEVSGNLVPYKFQAIQFIDQKYPNGFPLGGPEYTLSGFYISTDLIKKIVTAKRITNAAGNLLSEYELFLTEVKNEPLTNNNGKISIKVLDAAISSQLKQSDESIRESKALELKPEETTSVDRSSLVNIKSPLERDDGKKYWFIGYYLEIMKEIMDAWFVGPQIIRDGPTILTDFDEFTSFNESVVDDIIDTNVYQFFGSESGVGSEFGVKGGKLEFNTVLDIENQRSFLAESLSGDVEYLIITQLTTKRFIVTSDKFTYEEEKGCCEKFWTCDC